MSGELRQQAQLDLATTVQAEFGQQIKLSEPDNKDFKVFIGNSNDVHVKLDPDTGLLISGTTVQAVLILQEVLDQFDGKLPNSLWMVEFLELSPNKFRVKDVMPDASMGVLVLIIGN